jgi:hypothetical protein
MSLETAVTAVETKIETDVKEVVHAAVQEIEKVTLGVTDFFRDDTPKVESAVTAVAADVKADATKVEQLTVQVAHSAKTVAYDTIHDVIDFVEDRKWLPTAEITRLRTLIDAEIASVKAKL